MFAVSVLGAKGFHLLFEKTLREKYRAGIEKFGRGLRITVFILAGLTLFSLILSPELRSLIGELKKTRAFFWLTMYVVSILGAISFNLLLKKTLRGKCAGFEKFVRGHGLPLVVFVLGGLTLLSLIIGPEVLSDQGTHPQRHRCNKVIGYMPIAFWQPYLRPLFGWCCGACQTNDLVSCRSGLCRFGHFVAGFDLWLSGRHFVTYTRARPR